MAVINNFKISLSHCDLTLFVTFLAKLDTMVVYKKEFHYYSSDSFNEEMKIEIRLNYFFKKDFLYAN